MTATLEQFFFRPQQVADVLGVSRSEIYKLLKANKLTSILDGKKRLVPKASLMNYVNQLNARATRYQASFKNEKNKEN